MRPDRVARLAGVLSAAVNVVLSVLKITIGLAANSQVLVADGLHNVADLGASLAVTIGFVVARVPPDLDHPYGHQKAESVAAKIVGILLMLGGIEMMVRSVSDIAHGHPAIPGLIAAWVALASLVLKEIMFHFSRYAARLAGSKALFASAVDLRMDVVTSLVALVGILLARRVAPIFDPLLAAIVSLLVIGSGWQLVNQAVADLMDRFDDRALLAALRELALSRTHVRGVSGVRGRYMGTHVLVDMEIAVPGQLTVREGHDVATRVKEAIMLAHPEVIAIHVHVNPEEI